VVQALQSQNLAAPVGKLTGTWDERSIRLQGRLPDPDVPSYATLDARVGWHPKTDFELSLSGWNLTGGSHAEWGVPGARPEFERSVFFKIKMGS